MDYENFCNKVFKLSRKIRYVGIFHNDKTFMKMREGTQNLLSPEDTKRSLEDTMTRWKIRRSLSEKIGNPHYAMAEYDKIIRISIPFDSDGIILISVEPDVYPKIIIKEILEIKDMFF